MNTAVILLGSNTGDRIVNITLALDLIKENAGGITKSSFVYETEPWGLKNQPSFLNQVIELKTLLDARTLMNKLLEFENKMGRKRTEKWAPRLIDLDILYFNNEIINEEGLVIPHPHLHERRFTMEPLSEILPDMMHPSLRKKNSELLISTSDKSEVKVLKAETIIKQ